MFPAVVSNRSGFALWDCLGRLRVPRQPGCPGFNFNHMFIKRTSTQQRRAGSPFPPIGRRRMTARPSYLLDGRGATTEGGVQAPEGCAPAPSVVNETKVGIVAVMQELGRPTTSHELYAIWGRSKPEAVFDYHLSTLVRAGFAEIIIGPELRFRLKATVAVSPVVLQGRGAEAPPTLRNT